MSPFRLFATAAVCVAIALLSYSLLAIPPSYQEAVLALHLAGQAAPVWPEGVTDIAAIRALGAERGALSAVTQTLMQSQLMPPLWIWPAWVVDALPGGIPLLRALSAVAIGLSILALWPMFRRITPLERDQLYLMALTLLIPSTHIAASTAGPEAFAILGLSMALSGASAGLRERRLTPPEAALLGGGAGIAAASALLALPAAIVILIAGLIRLGPGRWLAITVALGLSLPLFALSFTALEASAPEIAAATGILAPTLATSEPGFALADALIASHPGRLEPPGLLSAALVLLALGAVLAGLNSLFRGRARPEFILCLLALSAAIGAAVIWPAEHLNLAPLAPLVAIMLGTGVLSLETKILAVPILAIYALTGAVLALTDKGEAHWQLAGEIAAKRDFLDIVVIDLDPAARPNALPYLMALRLPPGRPVVLGDAIEIMDWSGPNLAPATIAHIIHPPGPEGIARRDAFRAQFPLPNQRTLEQGALYDVLQLQLEHILDGPDGSSPNRPEGR